MFDGLYARGDAAAAMTDELWIATMVEVEAAMAAADPAVPDGAAAAIAAAGPVPADAVNRSLRQHATPVIGLVAAIREQVDDAVSEHVHHGATSQDVIDTAAMLIALRAREAILADGRAAIAAAARLADEHRATPAVARTVLQPALATSFGLRAAGWLAALARASRILATCELAVQMGGPVGHREPSVAGGVARALGLVEPELPWATDRTRVGALAGALGTLAGACAKIARDVALLSQAEIAEVREAAPGGSSAMPHKRNPVASVATLACAQRVPGLVTTLLAVMPQEHERGAGGWQAEWGALSDLLALTGSTVAWTRALLEGLEVDPERMASNLEALGISGGDLGASSTYIDHVLKEHL